MPTLRDAQGRPRRAPRILPSRLGTHLYAAGTERLPLKLAAIFFAVVLWVVAGAEEPTEIWVPVALAPLHDTALVLAPPAPRLRALVAGRRRELIKLYRAQPVLRYSFLGDRPDTVRLRVGNADIDLPAGVSARVLDVRPRESLLRFVSRDPRRDSLFRAVVDSVRESMGPAAAAVLRQPAGGLVIPPANPSDTTAADSAPPGDTLPPGAPRAAPPADTLAPPPRVAPASGPAPLGMPVVLGIETSCDETSAAVLEGAGDDVRLRSLVILSQDVHRVFGGVVPEIASRAHLTSVAPTVRRALDDAGLAGARPDAVAVTHAPGLVGALLVGVSFGKALAWSLGVPLVAVHHMEGHLFATHLEHPEAVPPFTALLVSGGHTLLLDVPAWGEYRLLGGTRDDAAGEAFDKVAKLLGLPYPGGRHVERLALGGDPSRFRFARPMLRRDQRPGDPDYYDVSFSGIKTAVLNAVRGAADVEAAKADLARGFQDALVDTLVEKTYRAAKRFGRARVVLGGGVACNGALVLAMRARVGGLGAAVFAPTPRLATDNAAMIARAGLFRLERGERAGLDLNAYASLPIPGLAPAAAPLPAPAR